MDNLTQILDRINSGDRAAADDLLTLVYRKLRQIAAAKLNSERPDHTFQTCDLVNEAYLRLLGDDSSHQWQNRGHFFGAAAESMRRILVEHARARQSLKRGGGARRVQLDESFVVDSSKIDEILDVHCALEKLEGCDKQAAEIVKLRYFAGMKHVDAAKAMEITRREADGLWTAAKTFLYRWINR